MKEDLNASRRETSGTERLSDKKYFKIVLAAGIIALTVFLMIFFKQNPDGIRKLVAEQSENLVSFYTNNLQPALIGSKLTVSDVFNFAVNDNLPIDKVNNTSLYIGAAANGSGFLELRPTESGSGSLAYQRFKEEAELNKAQEEDLDSILNSYKPQIEKLILSNEDNTIAVNANLWSLNKYILIDVVRFLKKEKKEAFLNSVMPHAITSSELETSWTQVKDIHPDDYVFIAPDTVFPMKYKYIYDGTESGYNEEQIRSEKERARALESAVSRIRANSEILNKQMNHRFVTRMNISDNAENAVMMQFDSSLIPPETPEVPKIPSTFSFKIDAVKDKLKEMSMKFGNNVMELNENRLKMKFYGEDGDSSSFSLDIDISGLDGLSEDIAKLADSISATNLKMNIDTNGSINNNINKPKEKTKAKSKSRSH